MFQQDVSRAVRAALLEDLGDALTTLDQPDASADITAQLIPAIGWPVPGSSPVKRVYSAASPGWMKCSPNWAAT